MKPLIGVLLLVVALVVVTKPRRRRRARVAGVWAAETDQL
ncbi:protein of unknown function [Micropruina glycogenica]|jgi:hypothetical protein|uniref:Uncharacterized protein n=1 Tax=Micropruina glycogenica TaxID=75385 RepID=A0A2N9JKG1_9ACTN|nr:protein of unknown function [Micropruina glycogenica]